MLVELLVAMKLGIELLVPFCIGTPILGLLILH